jgi:hypothetical protein
VPCSGLEVGISGVATIRNSGVSGNVVRAVSPTGAANVAGAGIGILSGELTIERTRVVGNRGGAHGVGGLALGCGILNVDFGRGPPQLTLNDSVVTANQLDGATGVTPRGGGIFSADLVSDDPIPFKRSHTVIAGNTRPVRRLLKTVMNVRPFARAATTSLGLKGATVHVTARDQRSRFNRSQKSASPKGWARSSRKALRTKFVRSLIPSAARR